MNDRGFTLIEMVITLMVISLMLMLSVNQVPKMVKQIEGRYFFYQLERQIITVQQSAILSGQNTKLVTQSNFIDSHFYFKGVQMQEKIDFPEAVKLLGDDTMLFKAETGNHSRLARFIFLFDDKIITYQQQLGSGKVEKKIRQS